MFRIAGTKLLSISKAHQNIIAVMKALQLSAKLKDHM